MLFQLPSFLCFLVVFAGLLWLCPRRLVQLYVVLASLVFYAWWNPPYVLVLIGFMVGAWAMARLVWSRPQLLPATVLIAVAPLALFKYFDFFAGNLNAALGTGLPQLHWLLPLGISFVTFTVISVLVDTAHDRSRPPPGFLRLSLYIAFFPHLIAGPILRMHQVIGQLDRIRIDWARVAPNLGLFAFGMMKKVLIADPVGSYVDVGFGSAAQLSSVEAMLALLGFAVQIYCDFSAYSDMAIALAGMFGVAFPENFRSPYAAPSMGEVWRRWHMTLSFWLRDYVFKGLHRALHRYGRYCAMALTMGVSGLWHGAAWTFILWGLAHGIVMVVEHVSGYSRLAARSTGLVRALCIGWTFLLWCLLIALFRGASLADAWHMLASAGGAHGWWRWPEQGTTVLALACIMLAVHPWDTVDSIRGAVARVPAALSLPLALVVILACTILAGGRPENFYYFDF